MPMILPETMFNLIYYFILRSSPPKKKNINLLRKQTSTNIEAPKFPNSNLSLHNTPTNKVVFPPKKADALRREYLPTSISPCSCG